jgi:hypothetical protein
VLQKCLHFTAHAGIFLWRWHGDSEIADGFRLFCCKSPASQMWKEKHKVIHAEQVVFEFQASSLKSLLWFFLLEAAWYYLQVGE